MTEEQKREARALKEGIGWICSDRRGRKVVSWLLDQAGLTALSYSSDALWMAKQEGRRSIGHDLLKVILDERPNFFAEFMQDYAARHKQPEKRTDDGYGDDNA